MNLAPSLKHSQMFLAEDKLKQVIEALEEMSGQ
jgi:hypothetical protein